MCLPFDPSRRDRPPVALASLNRPIRVRVGSRAETWLAAGGRQWEAGRHVHVWSTCALQEAPVNKTCSGIRDKPAGIRRLSWTQGRDQCGSGLGTRPGSAGSARSEIWI